MEASLSFAVRKPQDNSALLYIRPFQVSLSHVVCPCLAQLVERLTHRYSESTSSNPSNLNCATVCGDRAGGMAICQEVSVCSTRGGSQGMYITFASAKANKAEPTLALKPKGDITRNPKQGYQCPPPKFMLCHFFLLYSSFGINTPCFILFLQVSQIIILVVTDFEIRARWRKHTHDKISNKFRISAKFS